MKHLRILTLIACIALSFSLKAQNSVFLLLKDSTMVEFAFSSYPKIVNDDDELIVKTKETEVSYAYADVQRVFWGKSATPTGIKTATTEKGSCVSFRFTGDEIMVSGLQRGETASLYTIDGKMIATKVEETGELALSIPHSVNNIYIVRTSSGYSFKVARK